MFDPSMFQQDREAYGEKQVPVMAGGMSVGGDQMAMRRRMLAQALGGLGQNNTPNANPWGAAAQGFANGWGNSQQLGRGQELLNSSWFGQLFGGNKLGSKSI